MYASGSTLSSTVVQCILADGQEQEHIGLHSNPFLENKNPGAEFSNFELNKTRPTPRLSKTHLQHQYLKHALEKGQGKIVLVMRNPKDVIVSYYNHYKNFFGFNGTFANFMELVKGKRVYYGDIFEWYQGWWSARNHPNVLQIMYEDLVNDASNTIRKIAIFLGKVLSDGTVDKIAMAISFKNMSKKASFDSTWDDTEKLKKSYFRKGEVGDWKNWFNEDQSQWVDSKCIQLSDHGLNFTWV